MPRLPDMMAYIYGILRYKSNLTILTHRIKSIHIESSNQFIESYHLTYHFYYN